MTGTRGWAALTLALAAVLIYLGLPIGISTGLGMGAAAGLVVTFRRSPAGIAARLRSRGGWRQAMVAMGAVRTDPFARRPRVPELVDARAQGRSVVVDVRLPSDPARWRAFGEALRRTAIIRAPAMDPPAEIAPGVVRFRMGLDPLPDPLTGETTATAVPERDGAVLIGAREGGGEVVWRPSECPHLLLVGRTRGGKGVVVRSVLAQLARAGWHLTIIDPKASAEHVWIEDTGAGELVHGLANQVDVLERWAAAMDRRQAELLAARRDRRYGPNLDKVADLPLDVRPRPVLIVVDEAPALLEVRGERRSSVRGQSDAPPVPRELYERAVAACSAIAARGASVDVRLLLIAQRADAQLIGGGWVRSNVAGRVLVGHTDREGLAMLFGNVESAELVTRLTGLPGRGIVTGLTAADGPAAVGLQSLYLDQATVLGDAA